MIDNLDELEDHVSKLYELLEERETGYVSWWDMLEEKINTISQYLPENATGLIERPVSEKQCKKLGGHYWNHHKANDDVNEFGEKKSGLRYLVHYPNGEPKYRTCGLCGKRQKKKDEWRG